MEQITTKIIRGALLYNRTDKNIEVILSVQSKENKVQKSKMNILANRYSQIILLGKYKLEIGDEIIFEIMVDGVKWPNIEAVKYIYHPNGEGNIISIQKEGEAMLMQDYASGVKGVRFSNHSATVAGLDVYGEIDNDCPQGKGRRYWSGKRQPLGRADYCSLDDLKELADADLEICYPVANVQWSNDKEGELVLYSKNSAYVATYELKGTVFKKWMIKYGK
ncbi:MAG: hypothetical protein ACRCSG_07385 [Cellulosilyticaceae bacterium]